MIKILSFIFCFTIGYIPFLLAGDIKSEMRAGNKAFKNKDYPSAELNYRKALDSISSAPDVQYNLGCAIYMQIDSAGLNTEEGKERLTNVEKYFGRSGEVFSDKNQKEAALFNLGNTYLKKGEIDKAIDSYKKSLRVNPNNFSTKENLYYAQLLKQQQKNQDKQEKDKDKQEQQDKQEKDKDKQEQQDQNKENDQQENPQENKPEEQNNQQQEQEQKQQNISRDDAERILNALQQQENQTQENLEKQKGKPARASSGKNW